MYQQLYCLLCSKKLNSRANFLCKQCQRSQDDPQYLFSFNKKQIEKDQCSQCTYKNQADAIQCFICGLVFQEKLKIKDFQSRIKKQKSLIKCKKCDFENDISNENCLNCENQLFEHTKKECKICGFSVGQDNFERHYLQCLYSRSLIQEEEKELQKVEPPIIEIPKIEQVKKPQVIGTKQLIFNFFQKKEKIISADNEFGNKDKMIEAIKINVKSRTYCYYCYKSFQTSKFEEHDEKCIKKQEWINGISSSESRMTPLQIKAMMYMHDKCAKEHLDSEKQLQLRVQKLGFSTEDLENLQFYIENYAPIIIQIHVKKHMEFFVKDTHYRSQFQTNKSSGSLSRSSRVVWQDRMFDKTYNKAIDFERVKYGVINFTNDPKGVKCAASYGPSYFLLKTHVRDRCTFTDKDSSGTDSIIGTLKFSFKVVNKMNDQELKAAFKASKALEQSSGVLITYKQLQIHGPLQFSKDIERIYVSKDQIRENKALLDMVYEFSKKFKVQHDFI